MNRQTRRRNPVHYQNAGAFTFNNPFVAAPVAQEETYEESENKINLIINNVQTTRQDLQNELEIYEKKLTVLEQEFTQYQKLAMKVVAALKVIDNITNSLSKDGTSESESSQPPPPK
jgi:predicted ribosome quality control (RQC) complex YloA/Tae2 family protein